MLLLLITALLSIPHCGGEDTEVRSLGGDFVLRDLDGKKFSSSDQRGRIVLLFFGSADCKDHCRVEWERLTALKKTLGDMAREIFVVCIKVDPVEPGDDRLRKQKAHYGSGAVLLTGSEEELLRTARLYGATFRRRSAGGATVTEHSRVLYLIDRRGRLRHLIQERTDVKEMVRLIRKL